MVKKPLAELVAMNGQAAMAAALGCSAAAISKAISVGRDILVTCHEDGTYSAEEIKPFPTQTSKTAA
ncbi:TPA: Cro/Cl family transcriptional regulator [Pseudomonas aeruginosa]|uniref:Cro/CI family transcriptional regulator n=1 Tax=Pseudomonas aeruginosa TaxID=287 RepID=UPI00106B0E78|nr:Cro/CI family transcriptional regulator [Pseudomonas aeruginosa]HBO7446408.1 Cro/Cl family transcriptional regulator [Pseudomonas aeruginosa]HBO7459702.1 Cro/Cl family transcriptional regulator [Pseudomonas aeruginosa]HBO7948165.1 Cro/Cl family transcriptional regulator [Pseudomonas aeruginosa]HBO7961343.1 Cro/Cl family transcriptional regulator [Pseudomonas aeruginosa]HBO7981462.1 Cro/Cl family transcriptional regulator [Pseudomonas aeruginosa]